jgi:hypothetical protein
MAPLVPNEGLDREAMRSLERRSPLRNRVRLLEKRVAILQDALEEIARSADWDAGPWWCRDRARDALLTLADAVRRS